MKGLTTLADLLGLKSKDSKYMDAKLFFEGDFHASLFPLKTNLIVIRHHHNALEEYIAKILSDDPAHVDHNFLPQTRVHAAKPRNHLRRTIVLDPVASYFLYDLIYRNKDAFDQVALLTRVSFGYRFNEGHPVPVHKAYQEFLTQVHLNQLHHNHWISFDVASYFNSIYHHDATHWFASLPGVNGIDSNAFGRFFREINAGRSIDFLPQGIYPAKMIGSGFLRFVELSGQVKSAQLLRFMDDIYLFDNDEKCVLRDFLKIQELLGIRALNINPTKTSVDAANTTVQAAASAIQEELASIIDDHERPSMFLGSGADSSEFDSDREIETRSLDEHQIERLLKLVLDPKIEESDVEVILNILHEHTDSISNHIPKLLARFPNIVKQLHKLVGLIADKDELADGMLSLGSVNK